MTDSRPMFDPGTRSVDDEDEDDEDSSFSSSEHSDVSLNRQRRQRLLPLSNPPEVSACEPRVIYTKRPGHWSKSPLFRDAATKWPHESGGEIEDAENRRPDSNSGNLLTVPVNTSTPIVMDATVTALPNTASKSERVVYVKRPQQDVPHGSQTPVKSAESPTQPQPRTTPNLILPSNDDQDESGVRSASDLSVDPYKRARKFLYRLAPLLKLSLPSRVERRRTESVIDFNAQVFHSAHGHLPDPCSLRTTPWIRQWMKHGVMIHHCVTFSDGEPFDMNVGQQNIGPFMRSNGDKIGHPSDPSMNNNNDTQTLLSPWNSGPYVALSNADVYVQELWRELQLRLRGPLFMDELRKRRNFATTVMERIVSFSMQPTETQPNGNSDPQQIHSELDDPAIGCIQDPGSNGCTVSPNYLTLLVAASKSVSQLLQQTDRVEQAWSSDARLVREFPDWALPEVRCRLVCLRQWSGTLASLQRGVHQLCEFLHCPTSIRCVTHVTSVRQTTDAPNSERDSTDPVTEFSSCPLLTNRDKRGERRLYREFLQRSWLMPPLPSNLFSTTAGADLTRPTTASNHTDPHELNRNPHWGGLSMALLRLDRLVGRILVQVTDNIIPKTATTSRPIGRTAGFKSTMAPTVLTAQANVNLPSATNQKPSPNTVRVSTIPSVTSNPHLQNKTSGSTSGQAPDLSSAQAQRKAFAQSRIPIRKPSSFERRRKSQYSKHDQEQQQQQQQQHLSTHSLFPLSMEGIENSSSINDTDKKWNENFNQSGSGAGWRLEEPRRVASYAEIVKRRSWSGYLSPYDCHTFGKPTDMRLIARQTPVNWEICSPAPSVSPYARTPFSSSRSSSLDPSHSSTSHSLCSSQELNSNRSAKSFSASHPSSTHFSSSSNSSLPSMFRPRCAVAASPTSGESCASLLSVDLCNRSSLAHPLPPSPCRSAPSSPPPLSSPATAAAVSEAPTSLETPQVAPSASIPNRDSSSSLPIGWGLKSGMQPRSIPSTNLPTRPNDLGTELGLPTLVPLWLFLAQVPFDVVLEAVGMKLEQYEERMNGTSTNTLPNQVSLHNLVDELRELLSTALIVTITYRKRLITALQLDTMAQLRVPFSAASIKNRGIRCMLSCMHSDSDSDVPVAKQCYLSGGLTSRTNRLGSSGRWPNWFRDATHEVRGFLDRNAPDPSESDSAGVNRTWPISLPALLDVYVDCFTRLIDTQTWVGEGDPSSLRSRIETEWNFLRRLYRQMYRCRGGLQYFSMRNASLAVRVLPPTAEAAFIRACKRFLGLISKQLCPAIGDWVSSSLTMRSHNYTSIRSDSFPLDNHNTTSMDCEKNGLKIGCETGDSLSASPNECFEWTSPQSSLPFIPQSNAGSTGPGGGGGGGPPSAGKTDYFQEFNETWRELRAWLNSLLDLTGVMCGDLDTSVVLNFYVPHKCSSKAGSVLSSRLVYDALSPDLDWHASPPPPPLPVSASVTGQLSIDSEPGDTRMRAYARLARELRRTGHVLLHSWDQPKANEFSLDVDTNPNSGCIFIWSPVLQPNVIPDLDKRTATLWKLSADSTSGDRIDPVNSHDDCGGLVIVSPEERRAVRFHVSELVHRILRQLIFKFRKHTTLNAPPGVFPSVARKNKELYQTTARETSVPSHDVQTFRPQTAQRVPLAGLNENSLSTVMNDSRLGSDPIGTPNTKPFTQTGMSVGTTGPTTNRTNPEGPAPNQAANKRGSLACKLQAEYLLVCPEFPECVWDGLVYRFSRHRDGPDQSRSAYSRRLRYALSWLALMSTRGTLAPLFTVSVELSNLIPCHLLAERPYSAWASLCARSTRLRRWLSLGLSHMKSVGFERNTIDSTQPNARLDYSAGEKMDLTSPTNACILHLAPIHPDLGAACAQLHRSLCNLSARLHSSLLVMDSHLRGLCDTHSVDDYDRSCRGNAGEGLLHLRSVSPRRSTSKDSTTHIISGDTLQRAYSIVFGFHKTLMRLMSTAPLTNTLQTDEALIGAPSDRSILAVPIQTSLANLGVQLLASWSRFVTRRYHRGRGRIPRWANDACHFAYQLCQPRSVTFLEAPKVACLEATLNDLIPHLVGEEKSVDGNSLSPVLSRLSPVSVHESIDKPLFDRSNSTSAQLLCASHSFRRKHRRVHSLHSDRRCKRTVSATGRPPLIASAGLRGKHGGSLDSELLNHMGMSSDEPTTYNILSQLDAVRDDRLRQVGLIGRPRPVYAEQTYSSASEPEENMEPDEQNLKDSTTASQPATAPRLKRRQFPYAWNRGRFIGRGVTGEVYQAFNLQTHEMMAVKEIRFDYDTFADEENSTAAGNAIRGSDSLRQRTALLRHQREAKGRLYAFRRECDLLSSLSHPAVVRFLGADEQTPKVLRLFTELYTAGTLADVVHDRLPEALVRRYAHDLARAVAYLHDRGIVHRDIKPANIFLVGLPYGTTSSQSTSSTGVSATTGAFSTMASTTGSINSISPNGPSPEYSLVKLGDFSHALRLHTLSSNAARDGEIREVAGTVCYMAPEVCQSQSRGLVTGYGRPCDIWSYCCVILALVTGRQPWHRYNDSLAIFYRLCQNQTPPLPQVCPVALAGKGTGRRNPITQPTPGASDDGLPYVSAEAVALLQAGIQPDPSRRPTATDLFRFDFVNCPISYLGHIQLAHSR